MKQYVIIGNGVAAAGCIEGIRSADPNGPSPWCPQSGIPFTAGR